MESMQLDRRSDSELLAAARSGDGHAFGAFYGRHHNLVLTFLLRRCPNADVAADLLAETFAAALRSVLDGRRELPEEPLAWLLTISRNKLTDSLRRGRVDAAARARLEREPVDVNDGDLSELEQLATETDLLGRLAQALPPDQFEALRARVVDERDYAEIASSLSCSQAVVRKRVSRALRTLRTLAIVAAVAFALAAVALAASGVLSPGRPVPATPHLVPDAGLGVPAAGHSRLIASSAPDPAGGLPWSMRIVHTTRRLVCLQVGRLYDGQLGVVGEQGAFRDDKRFHPLPADAIGPVPQRFATVCQPDVETASFQAAAVTQSGELPKLGNPYEPSQERRLYFGLLGPDAVSVTYRRGRHETTVPVERGTGAYLIVLPSSPRPPRTAEFGGKAAGVSGDRGRLVPVGALTAIVYRTKGGTCVESWSAPRRERCPHAAIPGSLRRPRRPVELNRPIRVRLQAIHGNPFAGRPTKSGHPLAPPRGAVGGVYYEATVGFTAPFAVRNALSGYTVAVSALGCSGGGGGLGALGRDVRAGQTVQMRIANVFENACGRRVRIEVLYFKVGESPLLGGREAVVGRATVAKP